MNTRIHDVQYSLYALNRLQEDQEMQRRRKIDLILRLGTVSLFVLILVAYLYKQQGV